MNRRTPVQTALDRKADDYARRAKAAPKGQKWKWRVLANLARTEALKEGPRAK